MSDKSFTNDSKSRAWILTQRASDMPQEKLQDLLKKYVYIAQLERGEQGGEQGFEHYQIYIENVQVIRFSTLKNLLPTAHIEQRKGTRQEAFNYVTKLHTRIGEPFGNGDIVLIEESGARNDWRTIIDRVYDGATKRDIRSEFPTQATMYKRRLDELFNTVREERFMYEWRNVEVVYIYGAPRTGKTRYVSDNYGYGNFYRMTDYGDKFGTKERFDNYDGEDVILFEEFVSQIPLSNMLTYLEGHPLRLPARNHNIVACYTKVFIVSNLPLEVQYKNIREEQPIRYDAFLARIKKIYNFDKGIEFEMPHPLYDRINMQTTIGTGELMPVATDNELPF